MKLPAWILYTYTPLANPDASNSTWKHSFCYFVYIAAKASTPEFMYGTTGNEYENPAYR